VGSRRRLSSPALPSIGFALIVLLGGTAAAVDWRATQLDRADEEATSRARAAAGALGVAIGDHARSIELAARSPNPQAAAAATIGAAASSDAVRDVVVTNSTLDPVSAARDDVAPLLADPGLPAAAHAAASTGQATLAGPSRAAPSLVLVLAPTYEPGAELASVLGRRAALNGFVIGVVDLDVLFDDVATSTGIDAAVTPSDAAGLVAQATDAGAATVEVLGSEWTATVERDVTTAAAPAALALGAVATAIAVVLASAGRRRALAEAIEDAAVGSRQVQVVNEVGQILHRSLDLGEVLPALAIRLSDELDLAGVAVAVARGDGTLDEVFAYGARRADPLRDTRDLAMRRPVEGTVDVERSVPLERAGRIVGALWFRANSELAPHQDTIVRAVADLAGSAIGNARSYAQELEARRRLADLDQVRGEFLGTVSHELRTPATTILGFAELLSQRWDDVDDEQRRDLVGRIARNAGSLSTILEQLLDVARMERRSLLVERAAHDLDEIVRRVVDQSTPLLDQHPVEVRSPGPTPALLDPFAAERILLNLLTNASKYSPPGSLILVEVEPAGARAVLRVCDEGPGVPEQERALIFDRFYRGDGQHTVRTRGVGIGLAVVKDLTERLKATVDVSDAPGGGACFTVSFPTPHTRPTATGGSHDAA
jgi:signal transduction histidine kinase